MFELLMQGLSEIGAAMASGANQSPSVGRPPPAKAPAPDAAPKPPADPEAMNVLYGEMYAGPAANDQDPMAAAEKANAKLAVDLMNVAVQHGEPNQDLIRAQLGMLSPQAREKALGQLDPKAREAATAVIEKDELAAEQATHLLKLATAGDQVEQRAAREAMERMPAWKRKEILAQLDRGAARRRRQCARPEREAGRHRRPARGRRRGRRARRRRDGARVQGHARGPARGDHAPPVGAGEGRDHGRAP
jgi:hypothetical protein